MSGAVALLIAGSLAMAAEPSGRLDEFLERQRPTESHRVLVIAKAEGALQGEVPVIVVLFTFLNSEQRDPVHSQFLAALPKAGFEEVAPQLPSQVVRVGGAAQHFSNLSVSGGLIHLQGKSYAPDDPRCCPSQAVATSYRLDSRWLTALATAK